jgi:hypothetical protein
MLATVMIAVEVAMATASPRRGQWLVAGRLQSARTAARTSSTTNEAMHPRRNFDSHGFFCFLTRIGLHNSTPRLAEAVSLAMANEPARRRSMRS